MSIVDGFLGYAPALVAGIAMTGLLLAALRHKISLRRAVFGSIVALVVAASAGIVPPGHRGVVFSASGGVLAGERGEGVTFVVPFAQRLTTVSVRTQKLFSDAIYAQSLDLQEITVVASVNYHVEASRAAELYQGVGPDYETTVVQPALFQRTKAAVGQVLAEDFAANRAALAETVRQELEVQLAQYGIVVEYVNIEDAIFDPAFIQAVKDKIVAEQEAEEQRRLVAAEKAKKQQAITQAEARARSILVEARAQAEANDRIARSLTPNMLRWQWLVRWDGILPATLLGDSEVIVSLPQQQGVR